MIESYEPEEAFPYEPPTDEIRERYAHIFQLEEPLKRRFFKTVFDKLVASLLLVAASPVLLLVKVAYHIEGWLIPENKGPMFFHYNAVSAGKIIPKYNIFYSRLTFCLRFILIPLNSLTFSFNIKNIVGN